METVAQYTARIASHIEGKDPLAVQQQSAETLSRLIEGIPAETLVREPAPGKWSVGEVLAHMAEAELVSTWRYRQMVERNGAALASFDQNEWARLGGYATSDPKESLETFRLLRKKNLQMFAQLTPEEWQRFGIHAERGRMTLKDLVGQMAGHDLNHIAQVKQMVGKA